MQQTRPRLTTGVPEWLLLITVMLVVVQAAVAVFEIPRRASTAPAINWIAPESVKQSVGDEAKLLLYYFCADWCEGCHKLEDTAFKNKVFVSLLDREFVPVKVVDKHKETGKNSFVVAQLEGKYNVIAFPTLVVALPSGERAYAFVGAHSSLQAIRELKQAINRANYTRGKAALEAGRYKEAAAAFRTYLDDQNWKESQCRYAAVFCCISYAEQQQFDAMQKLAAQAVTHLGKQDWPMPALRFFAGEITAEQLKEMTDQEKGRLTEVNYYLGAYQCAKGNTKEARELLEWVAKNGKRDYEEYDLGMSRLQRLKASH